MRKKGRKKLFNKNQKSFYFEEYLQTNEPFKKQKKTVMSDDRIYILFFLFISLILIFSISITSISLQKSEIKKIENTKKSIISLRKDITDRNGILISRNITAYHAAVKTSLVKDKKKFLVKVKLVLPELSTQKLRKDLNEEKYFYLKKRLSNDQKLKLWSLGEKGIIFEPFQARVYPHSSLYSHVVGQIDYDNYGISGVEKYYDIFLKDIKNNKPLQLSLDTNVQFVIKTELENSLDVFKAKGGASLLMDADNGEIISLISLPDFDINKRDNIHNKKFMNKITKGVFELGSIFKTFTIALAIEKDLVDSKTIIKDISQKIKCSVHEISDIKKFPEQMTVQDILVQSSNIGTIKIARLVGQERLKSFLKDINILAYPNLELDELGRPIQFDWTKCKLETVSFGHGITTTPLQAATAYASLINGGKLITPTLEKGKNKNFKPTRIISKNTSSEIRKILRKVVTDEKGTAHLADIYGYNVAGKTGTSQYYENKKMNINTFISFFSVYEKKYVFLLMLDDPKIADQLIYDYRGLKIKGHRNEAGWNVVYSAGKIIEKIGPILAINNGEVHNQHVVKKSN